MKEKLLSNKVTIFFALIVVLSLFMSKQAPFLIVNNLVQTLIQYSFLALALIIPIRAGLGLNFSIVVGAIAGQIGIIMAVNWGVSGFFGFIFATLLGTCFAIGFGLLAGLLIDRARGHEMVTSLFIAFFSNGLLQFFLLALMGTVIPIKSGKLLLSGGKGISNSIDLKGSLYQSVDGLFDMPFFLLIILAGGCYLALSCYRLFKGKDGTSKVKSYLSIGSLALVIIISAIIMYTNWLPNNISILKNVNIPMMTTALIIMMVALSLFVMGSKFGQDIKASNVRVTAIVFSTVVASWGQIIYLQNTGVLSTYGSHMSVGLLSAAALIVGGATIKRATVGQAFIGLLLLQGFLIISVPVISDLFSGNMSEILRTIVMNGVLLYAFLANKNDKLEISDTKLCC